MSTDGSPAWLAGLKEDYEKIFIEDWSPYVGVIFILLAILALMLSGLFWGVFGGLKLWGDWFNNAIGLGPSLGISAHLDNPLMHHISLMNIMLVAGSFTSAMLSGRFLLNRPPKLEYIWAAVGGTLMGIGATLAGGCTTGGFFTPLLHISPTGWVMWVGLMLGAVIGLRLLLWTLDNILWGMVAPPAFKPPQGLVSSYPYIGLAVIVLVLLWGTNWYVSEDEKLASRAIIVLAGFAIGFIMNRSRFCIARSIREPFMTGEGDMTKAVILGLAVGIPITSLLFEAKIVDPYIAIPPRFWLGSLAGGVVFGVGMIFAGGCASGSLWRMGEGHIKLWVACFFFAWVGSITSALMKNAGWIIAEMNLDLIEETQIGYQAYLPVMLDSWTLTYAVSGGALLIWYLFVRYNETTEKFTLL